MKANQIFYPLPVQWNKKYTGPDRDLVPFDLARFRAGEFAVHTNKNYVHKFVAFDEGTPRPLLTTNLYTDRHHELTAEGESTAGQLMMYDPVVYERDNGLQLRLSQIPAGWRMLTEEERVAVCTWYGKEYRKHLKFADEENRFCDSFGPTSGALEMKTFYITDLKPGEIKTTNPSPKQAPLLTAVQPELEKANELLRRFKKVLRELRDQRRADDGELTTMAQRIRSSFTAEELE